MAGSLGWGATVALGQAAPPGTPPGVSPAAGQALQRAAQVDELEQIRFDRRLRADEDVPPGQRLFLD